MFLYKRSQNRKVGTRWKECCSDFFRQNAQLYDFAFFYIRTWEKPKKRNRKVESVFTILCFELTGKNNGPWSRQTRKQVLFILELKLRHILWTGMHGNAGRFSLGISLMWMWVRSQHSISVGGYPSQGLANSTRIGSDGAVIKESATFLETNIAKYVGLLASCHMLFVLCGGA